MDGPARKTFVTVVSVAAMLIGGCGGQESPSVKQGRALAAENIELRKQLEQRSAEIEKLTQRHSEELKKQQSLLEKCEQESQAWKTKAQQNIRDQVKGVLDTVVDENAKLREESKALKAQIEELQAQLKQSESTQK
jgi:cell division septum initiation protein DivIVA